VTVDRNGEGRYAVEAGPADRNGSYGIWLNPVPVACLFGDPCAVFGKSS
jgi:hypothetical protein